MKNWSGHIYFTDEFHWKDLEKAFPEIWDIIAGETKQNQEEAQYDQITLELNLAEIRKDKKPIGYIKDGAKYRMVFPEDRKEMIIYRGGPSEEIRDIVESVTKVLKNKKIKFQVDYDKMLLYEIRKRRK
ncbi:MAG: hypothetical protein M1304_03970 [Candidatus Thermoplasmatota archaeon]|nr:hypothetical protein [Candidatus Thermoplasmatota archaeon]WMT44956.1 MAG: hypothetical protein RE469_01850 [Cuniculiplasma divulgatum]